MTVDDYSPKELWRHSAPETSQLYAFKEAIAKKYNVKFGSETSPDSLYQWSIDNIANFWAEVWDFTKVKHSKTYDTVVDEQQPMFPRPSWFKGARINFAENLLFPASISPENEDDIAVIAATEVSREHISWKELRERVRACRAALVAAGLKEGDRVVGHVGNHANTLIASLAAASLGCIWSATSPDMGVSGVLERMTQIEPTILFADNAVIYNGKTHDNLAKLSDVAKSLGSLKHIVVFPTVAQHPTILNKIQSPSGCRPILYSEFLALGDKDAKLEFAQLEPDHPLFILYSSGTTGKPKCIVHSSGGTLLTHKKEHQLHCNMSNKDTFFQFTTVAWMMWHWNIICLASGTKLVLYDGSPFYVTEGCGDMAMPALIEELGITCFGTSAKYLSILEQRNTAPKEKYSLSTLRAIYSTGSVLAPSTFDYVYKAFGPDINLGSITGGTDIISLFGAPSPLVGVYRGEIQCRGLGLSVQAWSPDGKEVFDEPGDLVCTKAFPCMPVKFWGADGEAAYKRSYFEQFPGVWCHGDFIQISQSRGTLLMLGRSDGVLKPAGVRFGSAELYNVILARFADEVEDALCVGRRRVNIDTDESVICFLKMHAGHQFTEDLCDRIKSTIRKELSARHVPAIIAETKEIPVTTNGKKIEVAVKQILCMMNIKTSASVANPECLEFYRNWAAAN